MSSSSRNLLLRSCILFSFIVTFSLVQAQEQKISPTATTSQGKVDIFRSQVHAGPVDWERVNVKEDLKKTLNILFRASYLQFTEPTSWAIIGLAGATLWPVFNKDKYWRDQWTHEKPKGFMRFYGESVSNALNFPIVPIATYYLSQYIKNEKLYHFTLEYTATLYLTLLEAAAFSFVPVHRRPSAADLTPWEKAFRAKYSFPSGHMAGFATLTFKTFQYYGPLAAIIPLASTYITAYERVRSRKHYVSDVVGTVFFAWLASEGTRIAYQPKQNHPVYKFIFEHNVSFNFHKEKENFYVGMNMSF